MGRIVFDSVQKVYGGKTVAVDNFELEVADGEFLTLVGPSGSGKSTTLRMLAGLEEITAGEISIDDEVVNFLPPRDRDIAMVFQNYALYPHLSVRENLAFGLKRSTTLDKEEINRRVEETADLLGIPELLDNKPRQLSGGQKQRVATGRAIVREPEVFLFDEPLSNLDAKLRKHMRTELNRIQQELGTTTIYVTHDQEEAMTMSDRIAILNHGELQQVGSPREVYNDPTNLFVAQFIGSPSMNIFNGIVEDRQGVARFTGQIDHVLSDEITEKAKNTASDRFVLGIRPEDLELCEPSHRNASAVTVELVEPLGRDNLLYFEPAATGTDVDEEREYVMFVPPDVNPDVDDEVYVTFDDQDIHLFDEETGDNLLVERQTQREDPPVR
ncbi:ABC transporter ATP-binding protein [Haladaptatus sp. CMAA 1911]|uniref:ABC transporter ATP-binding protein n=1 Tax=unclassified Haladaptatus TaxID=2622732 RepID=UPI0037540161